MLVNTLTLQGNVGFVSKSFLSTLSLRSFTVFVTLFFIASIGQAIAASSETHWETVNDRQISIKTLPQRSDGNRPRNVVSVSVTKLGWFVQSQRDKSVSFTIIIKNTSAMKISDPLRLVIGSLDPDNKVSFSNATGLTDKGEPYFDLTGYIGNSFAAGRTALIRVTLTDGAPRKFSFTPRVERVQPLTIDITSPSSSLIVNNTPQSVNGRVSDPSVQVTLNGHSVANNNGSFQANVILAEGQNTVTASATNDKGENASDMISLTLDTTPPVLTVESPKNGDIVRTGKIVVVGSVSDEISGAGGHVKVTVNGVAAVVSKGDNLAKSVTLAQGDNFIKIDAVDQAGNNSQLVIKVTYQPPGPTIPQMVIDITSPSNRFAVRSTPQTVKGKVSDPSAQVTLNGNPVVNDNGNFMADVALAEGHNTITALATNEKGERVGDVISLTLDTIAPSLTVDSPGDGYIVSTDSIEVSGSINDGLSASDQVKVTVNGVAAVVSNGRYLAKNINLSQGDNVIKINATDELGNNRELGINVTYQPLPPLAVDITSPASSLTVRSTPQTVRGTVSDPVARVTLNGSPVANDNGEFHGDVALVEGQNTVTVRATNAKGEDISDVVTLTLDTTPPVLTVVSPKDGEIVRTGKIAVSGLVSDRIAEAEGQVNVTVNGVAAAVSNGNYLANNITLTEGDNVITIEARDRVGNSNRLSVKMKYQPESPPPAPSLTINITSPPTLLTVGSTPQTVKGTVSDSSAQVTLNGSPVDNNGTFQADVALVEGHNTVTARATNATGEDVSDVISLSLDMTPPYLTVESPKNGDTVRSDKIAVSGLINDIVRGTVAEGQAKVKVNGQTATVSNRSYLAENISLSEGENTIKIDASDNVGNTASLSIKVIYRPLEPQHIELLSGQNQAAKINAVLAQPLKVKLLDSDNKPVADKPVIYRVTEGDGVVGAGDADQSQGVLVKTDDHGIASTAFKLGSRAGTGNQRVRATSVGFDGEAQFYASATVGIGNKVTVNSGNNQRGAVNQALPLPFVVAVVDEGANVVPGAQIEFKVTQGGGKFQNGQTSIVGTTDSDGRATAEFTLGSEEGLDVHRVTATLVGSSLYAGFTASALKTGEPGKTSISGVVLDNQDQPLPGVTVRVDGTTREAQSDVKGQFKITEVPVGSVHLIADGSTTTAEGEWPTLAFDLVTVAGADNPLAAPIYLVKLDTANAKTVGDQDVTMTLPDVPGFALEVKAGSVTFPDGKKTGKLSVTPVNASKIPMAPPNGMQPQFIVTIQPVGAKFDPPARLTLPNVDGHKPGAQVEMYSYDHDLEEFVAIGLGTVSVDGSVIRSNEGVGVIKAGWHCGSQPGGSGCCTSPGKCQTTDANCNIVNKPNLPDTPGDCKSPKDCESQQDNPSDVPKDQLGDCKKPICNGGSPSTENANDPPPNDKCKECKDGQVTNIELDTTKTTVAYTFSPPSESVSKINEGLEELTKIGILASVNLLQIQGTLSSKECCSAETGKGKDVSGSVNGNFGGFSVKGKIWPPGPIPTFGPKTFNAGVASLTVKAQFVGGIFIGLTGAVSGEVGYKKNDCSSDPNDRSGCVYGQLNTALTPSISAEIGGSASLEFDCIFCVKETIEGSASLVAGELSWPLNLSAVGYNVANCSAGLSGGLFQFGSGSFKVGAKFSGSYQAEGGGKNTYDVSFDFVSCEISSAGVNCS